MLGTLLVAGCGGEHDGSAGSAEPQPAARAAQSGRIVDLAGALPPQEKAALASRLADSRLVTVVIVETGKAQSLEQIGWAVGGSGGDRRSTLVLIDPETRQVRLEGELAPEEKAAVASAMRDDLVAGRVAAALNRGLTRLEQLGR